MNKFVRLPVAALCLLALGACGEPDGPAERLGENIDDAASEVRDAVGDIGNEIEDACEEIAENAGVKDTDC